jgi:preprotein translocase subunit SecA
MLESLADAVEHSVEVFCPNDFQEDWDLDGLLADVASYYPTRFTVDELRSASSRDDVLESLLAEAVGYYEERERQLTPETLRDIERTVMMSIIDQRWREHLYEMDYLQEGINLRAMGQRDPLVEWQREGFDMFSQMMDSIDADFVKYVMHLDVVVEQERPDVRNVQYSAPEDPVQGTGGMQRAAAMQTHETGEAAPAPEIGDEEPAQAPIVKSDWERTGRNQPCPCGSGKKYKLCHGR